MTLGADAVDDRLDAGIQQLDDDDQQQAADQQRAFELGIAEPQRERREAQREQAFLPEGLLVVPGGLQPRPRIPGGIDDAAQAAMGLIGQSA